jgi:hypothetical protein
VDEPLIVNIADAPAFSHPRRSTSIELEPDGVAWPDTGLNVQIMQPGQPACAVLMIGSRREDAPQYPVSEVAAKYDASVTTATDEPAEAYADRRQEPFRPTPNPWPLQ